MSDSQSLEVLWGPGKVWCTRSVAFWILAFTCVETTVKIPPHQTRPRRSRLLLVQLDGENAMRTTAGGVHLRRRRRSMLEASADREGVEGRTRRSPKKVFRQKDGDLWQFIPVFQAKTRSGWLSAECG